tara:strand:+ start:8 stop:793 length:786 start_codon:yes stop_codon:yes gene_type:complete
MKKKCLFLGYNSKKTILIKKIESLGQGWSVTQTNRPVSSINLKKFHSIISFGYRHIISSETIKKCKIPIINLHIGYLPYNRGSYPNFWSFVENTPTGITIHEIDQGMDTGPIIYQKIIDFELFKNRKKLTFAKTYKILINEIEKLFIKNIKDIMNRNYLTYKQVGKGSYHSKSQLPKNLKNWNQNIYKVVLNYNSHSKNKLKNKINLIDAIENTRKRNNVNWMNMMKIAIESSPDKTDKVLKNINFDDNKISKLFKKLTKN